MAAAGGSVGVSGSSWPKWSVAVVVGVPVAVGVGYWYWKHRSPLPGQGDKAEILTEKPKLSSLASANQEISLDTGGVDSNSAMKEEVVQRLYEKVKEDCSRALELNPRYVKALQRRAKACEVTKDLQQSLEDVTSACILEGFQNQTTLLTADRVLKGLGRKHAKEAMAKRTPIMPSKHFIKTYFSSFVEDPITKNLADEKESESAEADVRGVARAKQAFALQNYDDIIPACTEELKFDNSSHKDEALVLRATFHLLLGDHASAFKDFEKVIDNENTNIKLRVNALIKRASLHMQLEDPEKSLQDFDRAANMDDNNSDVYHHRGQVLLLMEKVDEAISDFNKAVSINPNFPIAYVQKCYTDYRHAFTTRDIEKMQEVMRAFQSAIERFPKCSECYTLFAQVLSDQQEYEKADKYFKKAIEVDPENATVFVHRGLLHLQWNGDVPKAIELISQALELDKKCEFGYETLGTIEVQRGNLRRAVELFDKAIPLSKTELEMSHLFSLRDAAVAQATVADRMGIPLSNIGLP
uniref:Mitochondrial import receptor subunit TOM70 n=1 Tax=Timema bartmani TaxID=61472 RepID=A0A7R9F5Q0_9NEOP|nr:unnamed protein product [Timema bartmani]